MTSNIDDLLTRPPSGQDLSHRSRKRAQPLLAEFKEELGLPPEADKTLDRMAEDFLAQTVLGAAWYRIRTKDAGRKATRFIIYNALLVVAVPVGLLGLGTLATGVGSAVASQVTGSLTGVFALQKTFSAWYASQQRYAAWHKAASDLTKLYYGFVQTWQGKATADQDGFQKALGTATMQAWQILDDEELLYYQSLALPTFDVLDLLTSARSQVTTLVSSFVPAAPVTEANMTGTKTTLSGLPVPPPAPPPAPAG